MQYTSITIIFIFYPNIHNGPANCELFWIIDNIVAYIQMLCRYPVRVLVD